VGYLQTCCAPLAVHSGIVKGHESEGPRLMRGGLWVVLKGEFGQWVMGKRVNESMGGRIRLCISVKG
jgi:hypothetical protein